MTESIRKHPQGGSGPAHFPSEVRERLPAFDKVATVTERFVSRAAFFVFCLVTVLVWLPSYFVINDLDTWQLIINTVTTIVVFLLMALLQNTQKRSDDATQQKLNAIADVLADLMEMVAHDHDEIDDEQTELRSAVGLEEREASS